MTSRFFFTFQFYFMRIYSNQYAFNADEHTPVGLYLSLRNTFRNACLLESNDYDKRSESKSIIGLEPIVEITLTDYQISVKYPGTVQPDLTIELLKNEDITEQIERIFEQFKFEKSHSINGFYGRVGFEFALLTEDHIEKKASDLDLPDLHFFIYKYLIIIDHFKDSGEIIYNYFDSNEDMSFDILSLLKKKPHTLFPFETIGLEEASVSDIEFMSLVENAKSHCYRGDVFQLVLSNSFSQSFIGDDFNVYRQLRRLNPSPYLFYFDFDSYRLFGSSPEAQIKLTNGKAEIHPIAGTVLKTDDKKLNQTNIHKLQNDEKENAEHTMLVDLARNDLSKNCTNVRVENYKEIQGFSHVYHIVSKVTGLIDSKHPLHLFSDSFPAGTLSGSPKPKALELISKYENNTRDYYGGAIGFISSSGDMNMAIVIRSILSQNNVLNYRAGAGIVIDSVPENECQEIQNKLKAVRTAIEYSTNEFKITQDENSSNR